MSSIVRVIKLGGSLLDCPSLRERVKNWLATEPFATNLIVVGGGELVEAIRMLDRIHRFEKGWTHELCIDLMQVTARLLREILRIEMVDSPDHLATLLASSPPSQDLSETVKLPTARVPLRSEACELMTYVVAPSAYRHLLRDLPRDWSVTSDSIAAQLAIAIDADELCLLKSTDRGGAKIDESAASSQQLWMSWSAQGIVDECFPSVAVGVRRVRLINLREPHLDDGPANAQHHKPSPTIR